MNIYLRTVIASINKFLKGTYIKWYGKTGNYFLSLFTKLPRWVAHQKALAKLETEKRRLDTSWKLALSSDPIWLLRAFNCDKFGSIWCGSNSHTSCGNRFQRVLATQRKLTKVSATGLLFLLKKEQSPLEVLYFTLV